MAGYYVEYRTDDARLTIETMKKAAEKGALCLNYMKAENFIYEDGKVIGAELTDMLTGEKYNDSCRKDCKCNGSMGR